VTRDFAERLNRFAGRWKPALTNVLVKADFTGLSVQPLLARLVVRAAFSVVQHRSGVVSTAERPLARADRF